MRVVLLLIFPTRNGCVLCLSSDTGGQGGHALERSSVSNR